MGDANAWYGKLRCLLYMAASLPRYQGSLGPHGAHLGPVSPRCAPCWPHEPCYQGCFFPSVSSSRDSVGDRLAVHYPLHHYKCTHSGDCVCFDLECHYTCSTGNPWDPGMKNQWFSYRVVEAATLLFLLTIWIREDGLHRFLHSLRDIQERNVPRTWEEPQYMIRYCNIIAAIYIAIIVFCL